MLCNIISRNTYKLKDVIDAAYYEIEQDGDYNGKSTLVVWKKPSGRQGDFIIIFDDDKKYQGIISDIENEEGHEKYTLTIVEMPKLFDQNIAVENENLIAQKGIEDFIAEQIKSNFISSYDSFTNLSYLEVNALTHTRIQAKVPATDKIYNLCTYIGNALTNYGIFMDFVFTDKKLVINILNKEQKKFDIDTKISDVVYLSELYEIRALTKLKVLWNNKVRMFYLRTDRTITENKNDPLRAEGRTDTVAVTTESEQEMIQEARNHFISNFYQHKIEFNVVRGSKIIPEDDIYIGHKCRVKTKNGVKESIINGIRANSESSIISVTLGQMKVTLIEKLKGQ